MVGLMGLIFSAILFCIFVGMFLRLGRIESILQRMAIHQGAFEDSGITAPGHLEGCNCKTCQDLRKKTTQHDWKNPYQTWGKKEE